MIRAGNVRRSLGPAIVSVAVLGILVSAATTDASSEKTPQVLVVKKGLMRGGVGTDYAEYGLVLRNRSLTMDAIGVTIKVQARDSRGRAFTSDEQTITVIPAGTTFVVAGALIWDVSLNVARISTVVNVRKTAPRGRKLPPVSHVVMTSDGGATASLTNRYRKPLPGSATIYGVFLDDNGRIVASSGGQTTDAVIQPGQTVMFDVSGNASMATRPIASVLITIDPCGYRAFTRACPIQGATG
jgi:hypothetical protein